MIRLILVIIVLLLYATIGQIMYFVSFIVGKIKGVNARDNMMLFNVKFFAKLVFIASGTKLHIEGEENLNNDKAVLYIGNHKSNFDSLLLYLLVKKPTGVIAKIELAKVPFIGMWIETLHGFLMDRNDLKQSFKIIIKSIENIKKGINMWIFAEGTRSKNKNPLEVLSFKEGSFKVCEKTNCDIVPVAILNSSEIFENHKPFIKACDVYVKIGEPIKLSNLTEEEKNIIGEYTRQKIMIMLKDIFERSKNGR